MSQERAVFKEVMVLRDEAARLLGYPSHATFRLEEKMAKTPENVNAFLNDLQSRLTAGGERELEELKQFKKAGLESRENCLMSTSLSGTRVSIKG
jgi:metallopeptidase MepB